MSRSSWRSVRIYRDVNKQGIIELILEQVHVGRKTCELRRGRCELLVSIVERAGYHQVRFTRSRAGNNTLF